MQRQHATILACTLLLSLLTIGLAWSAGLAGLLLSPAPTAGAVSEGEASGSQQRPSTPETTSALRPRARPDAVSFGALLAAPTLPLTEIVRSDSDVHPSCVAEAALRENALVQLPKGYARPAQNCFKNCGGSLLPGEPRWRGTYLTLRNILFHEGALHRIVDASGERTSAATTTTTMLNFSAYFPMVSGVWPQPVLGSLPLRHIDAAHAAVLLRDAAEIPPEDRTERDRAGEEEGHALPVVEAAYFQAPSDFLSTYHTVVEAVLPAFHRLLDRIAPQACDVYRLRGQPVAATAVITARPSRSTYGFKKGSCHFTDGGAQVAARFPVPRVREVGGDSTNETAYENSNGVGAAAAGTGGGNVGSVACLETEWGKMFAAIVGGAQNVYGLRQSELQVELQSPTRAGLRVGPGRAKAANAAARATTVLLRELRVGNPTNCEPLWGPDPFYAEALARDQPHINVSRAVARAVEKSGIDLPRSEELRAAFHRSFGECQHLLWQFRSFFISRAFGALSVGPRHFAAPVSPAAPVTVLFASRRGDWARFITNEDDVLAALRVHLARKYGGGVTASLRVVRFSGPLSSQIKQLEDVTVFVANHGANILPSIFLRPNAGVITMSFAEPGFYPFSVFPSWLHWHNLLVEQDCNRRLYKGKCKWSSGNNNDMRLEEFQIQQLLAAVDTIVEAQQRRPRGPLHDPVQNRCFGD